MNMGYETKLYIVEQRGTPQTGTFYKYDNEWYECFSSKRIVEGVEETFYFFFFDEDGVKIEVLKEDEPSLIKRKYSQLIAMIDLCKCGFELTPPTSELYFYGDDGSTPVIEDRCGSLLTQMSVPDVIKMLESKMEHSYSRRVKTALALLKGCEGLYNDPQVLFYGH